VAKPLVAIVSMIGLTNCLSLPGEPTKPGTIHEVPSSQQGILNARTQHLGTVYAQSNGDCYVFLPTKTIGPPGSMGPTHTIDCPLSMQHESFYACGYGAVRRLADNTCECAPYGNPPPAPHPTECPGDAPAKEVSLGAVAEADPTQVGTLNARSEHHGHLFGSSDGTCYVRVTTDAILPPGSTGPTTTVDCPPSMQHPSFAECGFGLVQRKDDTQCVCDPWAGNPPPAARPIDCPAPPDPKTPSK